MEWLGDDFECSPLMEEPLYGLLSSPLGTDRTDWNFEENKIFENALAEFAPVDSPGFFENVASKIPWKTIGDIKSHYEDLVRDVEMIENDRVPIPEYKTDQEKPVEEVTEKTEGDVQERNDEGATTAINGEDDVHQELNEEGATTAINGGKQRKRGIPWTEEEHQLFLMGLNKYGKGDWRSIARYYVVTKTPTQVASHAQKYYRRRTSSTPVDKRRPSIHDIQTINPATFAAMHGNDNPMITNVIEEPAPTAIPNYPNPFGLVPMLDYNYNMSGFIDQNNYNNMSGFIDQNSYNNMSGFIDQNNYNNMSGFIDQNNYNMGGFINQNNYNMSGFMDQNGFYFN